MIKENKNNFKSRIKVIWRFACKYKRLFILSEICIIVLYAVPLLLPLNLALLVNDVLSNTRYDLISTVLINYLVLFIISFIFNILYSYFFQSLINSYIVDVKNTLFTKVMFAKAGFLCSINTGDIMNRIDNDANQFIYIIQRNLFHFVNSILMCLGIIYIVALNNLVIAVMLVIAAILPIIITKIYGICIQKITTQKREIEGNYDGRLFEMLKGMREIKLMCAKKFADSQIIKPLVNLIHKDNELKYIRFKSDKILDGVNLITAIAIYGYSINLILNYEMSLGIFIAVIEYVNLLNRKMNWIFRIYLDWTARKVSVDRVSEILSLEQENMEQGENIDEIETLSFKNVSFAYDVKNILEDISFNIDKCSRVGIVGISGVGKTTVTSLITKLFSPRKGYIYINGREIKSIKNSDIRSNIGIIGQDVFLFNESIRYNLTLGNDTLSDEELYKICNEMKLDNIDLDAQALKLSGGQKQRILIARMILSGKKFIILDEATAALDVDTENIILDLIEKRSHDKTLVIISHRLNTIKNCNKIIVINNGKIENTGTHEQLLIKSEVYFKIFGQTVKEAAGLTAYKARCSPMQPGA